MNKIQRLTKILKMNTIMEKRRKEIKHNGESFIFKSNQIRCIDKKKNRIFFFDKELKEYIVIYLDKKLMNTFKELE